VTESLLTARQIAELLGFAPGTIVDWAEAGKLPHFRIGGRLRFRESEIVEWLEQRRKGPGARGEASPTPSANPARRVVLQASPTPLGGEDA
jgi:excisionase family DNA binding protein